MKITRYYDKSTRWDKINKTDNTKYLSKIWSNRNSHSFDDGVQIGATTLVIFPKVQHKYIL